MFVACSKCEWSQDDFWSKEYNPLRSLMDWEDALLTKDLDGPFPDARRNEDGRTWRQVLLAEVTRHGSLIESMRWRTPEELKAANLEQRCPVCGGGLRLD